jgi:general secretion pathway protein C
MKTVFTPRFAAALAALALWALVAASALYWVWQVRTPPVINVPVAGLATDAEQLADSQAVARALGAGGHGLAGAGDMTGRFVLRGVVTHGPDSGAALIAVDGKLPKPVRVGMPVGDAGDWILRAVTPGSAVLASGAREVTLNVPRPDSHLDTHAGADLDARGFAATAPPAGRLGRGLVMPPAQP